MNSKIKGNIGESVVLAEAIKRGITVLQPFGNSERYDLVFEQDGEFKRIQVKAVTPIKGVLRVSCKSMIYNKESKTTSCMRKYSVDEIDLILVVNLETFEIYKLNVDEVLGGNIFLRIANPKKNQVKNIKFARDYLW